MQAIISKEHNVGVALLHDQSSGVELAAMYNEDMTKIGTALERLQMTMSHYGRPIL